MENNNAKTLLARLRAIDFAIYETILYLDAYPDNAEALAYYHRLLTQRKPLVAEYEKSVGPLTACGNASTDRWTWVDCPWPWEYEAN